MNGRETKVARLLPATLILAVAVTLLALATPAWAATSCGNAFLEPPEECDPPGSTTCPPGSPAGAFLPCNGDCTCPTLVSTTSTSITTTTFTIVTTSTTSTTLAPCGPNPNPDACIDDFSCYRARPMRGSTFTPVSVSLADQFEVATATARKVRQLCLPANKEQEGTIDPATHLTTYLLKGQSPRHVKRTGIKVTNQLGEIRLNTIRPDILLVPSGKGLTAAPGQPSPASRVDHYKCYRVRVTAHTPAFGKGTLVDVADQFEAERQMSLIKPRHLCNPVDKNGEGIKNATVHLLCYQAKAAVGEPRHTRRAGVYVENQFGLIQLDTLKDSELCIPSTKSFD